MTTTEQTPAPVNADMIRLWNDVSGPIWLALQRRLDAQLDPVGMALLSRLELPRGGRVLDIGCGCGSTSLELARRVGSEGHVTGVDISAPMLARAAERAAAAGLGNVDFVRADAQTHAFEAGAFDVAFSRFGVMFFDNPTAAFRNLCGALAPGAPIAFVCWRTAKENAWVRVPMEAALKVLTPPPPPDPEAPGPFAFARRARLEAILTDAGFDGIDIAPYDAPIHLGGAGELDEVVDFVLKIGPTAALLREQGLEHLDAVRAEVRAALAPHHREGAVALDGAMWIVHAKRRTAAT